MQRALEELQVARDALVKDRTAALNRQKQVRHRLLKQQHKNRLAQLDRHLAAIDTEIGKRLAEDEGLARRAEILTSIPGVSHVTAAGLLTQMSELGRLDAKAVDSLAGLAPVTRQSGAWQGRSFIQGGRARARRLLYMPALAAIRYNWRSGPLGTRRVVAAPARCATSRCARGGRSSRALSRATLASAETRPQSDDDRSLRCPFQLLDRLPLPRRRAL